MSLLANVLKPSSLDELQTSLSSFKKGTASRILFRRSPAAQRATLRVPSTIGVEVENCKVRVGQGKSELSLVLDNFDLSTKYKKNEVVIEISLRSKSAMRIFGSLSSLQDAKNVVFVQRALNAVKRLDSGLSKDRLEEATAAPNDLSVLTTALTSPELVPAVTEEDPLAAARLRGIEVQKALLEAAGGGLTVEDVAKLLSVTRQAVDKRRKLGQLIGLTIGRRGYIYPAFQFEGGRTLNGLERVLAALKDHDPWTQLGFFFNTSGYLGDDTPLQVLRADKVDDVVNAATCYLEQGAA